MISLKSVWELSHVEATHTIEKPSLWIGVREAEVKEFRTWHVPNLGTSSICFETNILECVWASLHMISNLSITKNDISSFTMGVEMQNL
jgi:hypothetical protein